MSCVGPLSTQRPPASLVWSRSRRSVVYRSQSTLIGRQIVFGADPTTEMTIGFAIKAAVLKASVLATSRSNGSTVGASASTQVLDGTQTRYARVALIGLTPDTEYDYEIYADGRSIGKGFLRTARSKAHQRSGLPHLATSSLVAARAVLGRDQAARSKPICSPEIPSWCRRTGMGGPGDIFRPGLWDRWIAQNDDLASCIPWMCVPGNHEMEPGFSLHGYAGMLTRVPIGGSSPIEVPVASKFQVGSVGFIGLDSNDVSYGISADRGGHRDVRRPG